ncbi:Ig-like domain-containing protein [Alteromonas gilva]|uniref:Ig-like domain-containing protein n=1 Tax=Alteromonas gilva TaxID=2987522 RepID=A0ABT5L6G3_9ALTE|nr:Ig-like domain-containing protein [Alteromonas gilva]MDC8832468.1 Ig-like domain-containing protein [Alteromonas gilva]
MKSVIPIVSVWLVLLNSALAAVPSISPNTPTSNVVSVAIGETVQFSISATDSDSNLSGAEWYGHGDNPFVGSVYDANGDTSNAIFSRAHAFTSAGNYTIAVVVYDADYGYSQAVEWQVSVVSQPPDFSSTPASQLGGRGLYVNDFDDVLASASATNKLLAHIQAHQITKLTLYDLHTLLPAASSAISNFIYNAKQLGVNSVGAAGGSEADFDRIMVYQNSAQYANKFDTLYLEYEYWNNNQSFSYFLSVLDYMDSVGGTMPVETYLGWPDSADYAAIASRVDNLFLHCYVTDASIAVNYCKTRLQAFGELYDNLNIWPIFSAEWRPATTCDNPPWPVESLCFMGDWFSNYGIAAAESEFLNDYNALQESWQSGIHLPGFYYFAYSFLDEAVGSPNTPDYGDAPVLGLLSPSATTVSLGQSVTISVTATDNSGNLSGIEWYGNGDNPLVQYVGNVGGNGSSATFSRTHQFNSVGTFNIIGVAFDTNGNYSNSIASSITVTP